MSATAILLAIGGLLTAVFALTGVNAGSSLMESLALPLWAEALYGLLYVALAWAIRAGRPWARVVALALSSIGLVMAVVAVFTSGVAAAVADALWPVVYLILLNTESARAWFGAPPPPAPEPPARAGS